MTIKLRPICDKSQADYTVADVALLRSPTVEHHLDDIRQALALATLLHDTQSYIPDDRGGLAEELERDAATALARLLEHAWCRAAELSEGLPADVQNLAVTDIGPGPTPDPSVVERLHALCRPTDAPDGGDHAA